MYQFIKTSRQSASNAPIYDMPQDLIDKKRRPTQEEFWGSVWASGVTKEECAEARRKLAASLTTKPQHKNSDGF